VLFAASATVSEDVVKMKTSGGELRTKQVTGTNSSMTIATRTPGYHSQPHFHDCEQINFVTRGEIWVFVEYQAFVLRRAISYAYHHRRCTGRGTSPLTRTSN